MQEWYLGREKVSCLERCPQFMGVSIVLTFALVLCVRSHGFSHTLEHKLLYCMVAECLCVSVKSSCSLGKYLLRDGSACISWLQRELCFVNKNHETASSSLCYARDNVWLTVCVCVYVDSGGSKFHGGGPGGTGDRRGSETYPPTLKPHVKVN